ncbi:hypothetical protein ACO0LB_06135 [Undibacterium sp. SXout7W]|uniref:hypothetical protein n=1 Tax=Undibacterium sp. SXout7W TaxID=3413049 RepID=UPI003BF150FD
MIVPKHRILQAYAVTFAPGKEDAVRLREAASMLGVDVEVVAGVVAESLGVS